MENNKINVAELLKYCPSGMELDCTILYDAVLSYCDDDPNSCNYPISIKSKDGKVGVLLTKRGQIINDDDAKCVIFPKGKTTWEGFEPPYKFKDGDVLYIDCNDNENTHKEYQYIFILKEISDSKIYCYCYMDEANKYKKFDISWLSDKIYPLRFATEEEKEKLFQAIKERGYHWNAETKTLEKLIEPKFKVGDIIKNSDNCHSSIVKEIRDDCFIIKTLDEFHNCYITDKLLFSKQDKWELIIPNKFDIDTLVPFESKVLVRNLNDNIWRPAIWGCKYYEKYYIVGGLYWNQCIPYEGNEHLLSKTDDCDDYYKTW